MKVLVDVWGGFEAQRHDARFIRNKEEALKIVETEILKGFLCNVRVLEKDEETWPEFDRRKVQ